MNFLILGIALLIGYLLGSIPFALVIGKVFYKIDIRQFGSGNLGGTNTGRVLGKKAGISVMVLDVLKVVLAATIVYFINKDYYLYAALGAAIGHCYPIFAGFKGGKAVATMFGYLLSMAIFNANAFDFLVPFACFILILYLFKMVSLSSILVSIITVVYVYFNHALIYAVATLIFSILIIYRHKDNIKRILNKEEKKITWM